MNFFGLGGGIIFFGVVQGGRRSELNPSAPATSIGAQRFGEQFGIFLGPIVGGFLILVLGYQGAIIVYGGIMIIGSIVFQLGVSEPKRLKVLKGR